MLLLTILLITIAQARVEDVQASENYTEPAGQQTANENYTEPAGQQTANENYTEVAERKSPTVNYTEVFEFLKEYGYVGNDTAAPDDVNNLSSLDSLSNALYAFQDYYKLNQTDGTANAETLRWFRKPRCGVADIDYLSTDILKWNKHELRWYALPTYHQLIFITQLALNAWQDVSNLSFQYSATQPDIFISFAHNTPHQNFGRCMRGNCSSPVGKFGSHNLVGHAYLPNLNQNCVEVHLDSNQNWYYKLDPPPEGMVSLYSTIMHELGHALGLSHSNDAQNIMFSFTNNVVSLSKDDISRIQKIYGPPHTPQRTPIRATPRTPARTIPARTPARTIPARTPIRTTPRTPITTTTSSIDLCSIYPDKLLITNTHRLYVFYKDLVWIINLNEPRITYEKPKKITAYLPDSIESFSHIYQSLEGDLVVITHNGTRLYRVEFPNLVVRYGFRGVSVEYMGIPKSTSINAVFSTYTGKTFAFHDNEYTEISDCDLHRKSQGFIKERFPGIPTDITSAFRYINGNIYFFKNQTYYEYNEFLNRVTAAGDFEWTLFGVHCPTNILGQLRKLLASLTTYMS